MTSTETREFPVEACYLRAETSLAFQLAAKDADGKQPERHRFSMVLNTGKPMDHWLFGKLVIDLDGVKTPAKKLGILLDHDPAKRIGFAMPDGFKRTGNGIEVEGELLKSSPHAQEVIRDHEDGFPWQASPFITPERMEQVSEGRDAEVNGQKVAGPAVIFRQSRVLEGSFVALGADDDTSASAFARGGQQLSAPVTQTPEGEAMSDETEAPDQGGTGAEDTGTEQPQPATPAEPTPAEPAADPAPGPAEEPEDPHAFAVREERARVARIVKASGPGQEQLARELIETGAPLADALERIALDANSRRDTFAERLMATDEPLGGGNSGSDEPAAHRQPADPEQAVALEWQGDSDLREEFDNDFDAFKLWKQADKAGRIRIVRSEAS